MCDSVILGEPQAFCYGHQPKQREKALHRLHETKHSTQTFDHSQLRTSFSLLASPPQSNPSSRPKHPQITNQIPLHYTPPTKAYLASSLAADAMLLAVQACAAALGQDGGQCMPPRCSVGAIDNRENCCFALTWTCSAVRKEMMQPTEIGYCIGFWLHHITHFTTNRHLLAT